MLPDYDKYHALTVRQARITVMEDRKAAVNECIDLPFLIESEYNGDFLDCGYCLDQSAEYTIQDIQHLTQILT